MDDTAYRFVIPAAFSPRESGEGIQRRCSKVARAPLSRGRRHSQVDTLRGPKKRLLAGRFALLALFVLVGLACASVAAAQGAEAPREMHGMADAFAAPGVAMAWAVARGPSETATIVVARIVTDPAMYPWLAVTGVDPFTNRTAPLLAATRSAAMVEVRSPWAHFADFPRSEFRFYESAAAAQQDLPALVVFFLGVPDTTPEFVTEDKLGAYLGDRIARLAATGAGKPR